MGEEVRGARRAPDHVGILAEWSLDVQEAQAKYRESKAELDELVANMEGL